VCVCEAVGAPSLLRFIPVTSLSRTVFFSSLSFFSFLLASPHTRIRIWSAEMSSGQSQELLR
jgi:hypothetical protein